MNKNNKPAQLMEGAIPEDDEPVLDLTDEVIDTPEAAEEIIDLIDEVDTLAATADLEPSFDDDLGVDHEEDDFVDSLGMEITEEADVEIASGADKAAGEVLPEVADISGTQLDAALERVIRKMFYDKIDRVLVEVIEKTVTKEIERLKSILLEEASGSDQ
jgi:hypothetical protein